MIYARQATFDDAVAVAALLRAEDAAEMLGLGYATPLEGVTESVKDSACAWALYTEGGEPLGIMGYAVSHVISRECHPWLVTTRHVDQHRIAFGRSSRKFVQMLRGEFALLENWVDARYVRCVEWLLWLGFDVEAAAPIPPTQMLFHRFTMRGTA